MRASARLRCATAIFDISRELGEAGDAAPKVLPKKAPLAVDPGAAAFAPGVAYALVICICCICCICWNCMNCWYCTNCWYCWYCAAAAASGEPPGGFTNPGEPPRCPPAAATPGGNGPKPFAAKFIPVCGGKNAGAARAGAAARMPGPMPETCDSLFSESYSESDSESCESEYCESASESDASFAEESSSEESFGEATSSPRISAAYFDAGASRESKRSSSLGGVPGECADSGSKVVAVSGAGAIAGLMSPSAHLGFVLP